MIDYTGQDYIPSTEDPNRLPKEDIMPRKGYKTKKMLEEEIRGLKAELEAASAWDMETKKTDEKAGIVFDDPLVVTVVFRLLGIPADKQIESAVKKFMPKIGCSYGETKLLECDEIDCKFLVFHRD